MLDSSEKINFLRTNGFVVFDGFLCPDLTKIAHDEIKSHFEKDLREREENDISNAHYDGVAGHTVLTKPSHLMLNAYGKSPVLDKLVDKILTDPLTSTVLKKLVGDEIDFYGYNIRLMTGENDPAPAHEFHRDSPGEVGIGILLTDTPADDGAATALVPGSHHYPYCPRWNTKFKNSCSNYFKQSKLPRLAMQCLPFNRLLARKINKLAIGAFGKRGTVYFFINDTWHGRQPNLKGSETMVMLIGGCPTDMRLHHPINTLSDNVEQSLPESVRRAFCDRNKPKCTDENTLIKEMLANRQKLKASKLFYLAQLERRVFDKVKKILKQNG